MLFKPPYTWLTTKPRRRLLSKDHPEWLCLLPIVDINNPTIKAIITYTDTTTANKQISTPILRAGEPQCFDVSYSRHSYDDVTPGKTIKYITIRVESTDFADQTAQDHIIYYPYSPNGDNIIPIYYHNSYDGIDSIICVGDSQSSIETNFTIHEKPLDLGYELGVATFFAANQSFRESVQLTTGNKPVLEIYALHDLFALKSAYEYRIIDSVKVLIPIIPTGNGIAMPSKKTNIKSLSFSYQYAYTGRAKDRQAI